MNPSCTHPPPAMLIADVSMISLPTYILDTFQEGSRQLATSLVRPLVKRGVVVGCVGYDLAPAVTMDTMVDQATRALKVSLLSFLFPSGAN